jgi:hypothetical protein
MKAMLYAFFTSPYLAVSSVSSMYVYVGAPKAMTLRISVMMAFRTSFKRKANAPGNAEGGKGKSFFHSQRRKNSDS